MTNKAIIPDPLEPFLIEYIEITDDTMEECKGLIGGWPEFMLIMGQMLVIMHDDELCGLSIMRKEEFERQYPTTLAGKDG